MNSAPGGKLGIDATKKIAGEGFKREWSPLIKTDEAVRNKSIHCLEMPVTSFEKPLNVLFLMKQRAQINNATEAQRWARRLTARVGKVLAAHPHADPDNVRHTLILLEQPPLERLQRSLIRGRATAIFRR
jgi:hypothetical protein